MLQLAIRQSQQQAGPSNLAFLPEENNEQLLVPIVLHCQCASLLHIDLIIFLINLACSEVSGHISGPKPSFLVKTMHATISQVYLHRLYAAGIKFLIFKQQQYPRHREQPIPETSMLELVTLEMLKSMTKKVDAVKAS